MLDHKLVTRRRLKAFNDDSIPYGSTLDSLKSHRMSIARQIFGRLGSDTNIEPLLFCTWGCNTFIGDDCYINRKSVIERSHPR
jgi:acetyltransferase-like isoleucine patch superfamily enzyme